MRGILKSAKPAKSEKSINSISAFKSIRKKVSLKAVMKYLLFTALAAFVTFAADSPQPFAMALFAAATICGFSPILAAVCTLLAALFSLNVTLILTLAIALAVYLTVFYIFSHKNVRFFFYAAPIVAVALVPYVFFSPELDWAYNAITLAFTAIFTLVSEVGFKRVFVKGFSAKADNYENLAVVGVYVLCAIGFQHALGTTATVALSFFLMLLSSAVLKKQSLGIISTVLAFPILISTFDASVTARFLIAVAAVYFAADLGKYVSGFALFLADFSYRFFFATDTALEPLPLILSAAAVGLFFIIPSSLTRKLQKAAYSLEERRLIKQTVNDERICLADKLFELSSVFSEISDVTCSLGSTTPVEESSSALSKRIIDEVCLEKNGKGCALCRLGGNRFDKLAAVGLAKGKVSLIDVPETLASSCSRIPAILYTFNKRLSEFKSASCEAAERTTARELIARQSLAVAELLKGIATETSKTAALRSGIEKNIGEELSRRGIKADELMAYGDDNDLTVRVLGEFDKPKTTRIAEIISKVTGVPTALTEKTPVSQKKTALQFSPAPSLALKVGCAFKKKDGTDVSGDTYSITEISPYKTLLAVSDGMGSGKEAEKVSSGALSLIESFYRAGLSDEVVTDTVNKILSVNQKDCFAALDVAALDLKNGKVSVMKYGAVYSFIITESGVKIIESAALPLGILGEITPSVATTTLSGGDIIVMFSDGISDAFGSTAEMLSFITENISDNPQFIAERLLGYAVKKDGGLAHDDMTVLCGKVLKRTAS